MKEKEILFKMPCVDFDPLSTLNGFIKIPNSPGIYVWGYWVWIDGKKTFCPMNVGETGEGERNLRTRLMEHYCSHFENKDDGTAAFFEVNNFMTQERINELYKQLDCYCALPRSGESRLKKILDGKNKGDLNMLIFYQDKRFFEFIKKSDKKNIGFYSLIEFIKGKKKKDRIEHGELLNKFIERQEVHLKNFFCVFAELDRKTISKRRRVIENTVNKALFDELGIATIARKNEDFDCELKINLGVIKNHLVKINPKGYINNKGCYHENLTISAKLDA
jgi:hypothetical protein